MKFLKYLALSAMVFAGTALAQVNINTATAEQLAALPGIGPVKAKAIIDYRKKNGKFTNIKDLVNVKGIGEQTVVNFGSDAKTTGATDVTKVSKKAASQKKKSTKTKAASKAKKDKVKSKAKDTQSKVKSKAKESKSKTQTPDKKKTTKKKAAVKS